jgi:2-keto-3-deoxy-6-phosphogluconate aldolase
MTDVRSELLADAGLVPVITIDRADDAGAPAAALVQGGIPYAEITFRTPAAAHPIDRMRSEAPQLTVGAGTVLTVEQADRAVRSGAQFLVSPALDPCGGSWIASREAIAARRFEDIVAAAEEAWTIVRQARRQRSETG